MTEKRLFLYVCPRCGETITDRYDLRPGVPAVERFDYTCAKHYTDALQPRAGIRTTPRKAKRQERKWRDDKAEVCGVDGGE